MIKPDSNLFYVDIVAICPYIRRFIVTVDKTVFSDSLNFLVVIVYRCPENRRHRFEHRFLLDLRHHFNFFKWKDVNDGRLWILVAKVVTTDHESGILDMNHVCPSFAEEKNDIKIVDLFAQY